MFGLNPLSVVLWVFWGDTSAACDMHRSVCSYVKVGILPIALIFQSFLSFVEGVLEDENIIFTFISHIFIN